MFRTSRFIEKKSIHHPMVVAAVETLQELTKEKGGSLLNGILCHLIAPILETRWRDGTGASKRTKARESSLRLIGKRVETTPHRLPWEDHTELWLKDGKPFEFISQPYGLSQEATKSLVEHCEKHGLSFEISAASWHYPLSTVLIRIRKAEER